MIMKKYFFFKLFIFLMLVFFGGLFFNSQRALAVDYSCTLSGSMGYLFADVEHSIPPNLPTKKIIVLKNKSFNLMTTLLTPIAGGCENNEVYIGIGKRWRRAKCDGYGDKIWGADIKVRLPRLYNYEVGMAVVNKITGEKVYENRSCGSVRIYQEDRRPPIAEEGLVGWAPKVGYGENFSKWIKPAKTGLEIGGLKAAVRFRRKAPCLANEIFKYVDNRLYWCGYADFSGFKFYRGVGGMTYPLVGFIDGTDKVWYSITPPNLPGCTKETCWVRTRISKAKDVVLYTRPLPVKKVRVPRWRRKLN